MTKDERLRAFALRCDGHTWEEIGAMMAYDGHSIASDLRRVLEKRPRVPAVQSPAVRAYLTAECGGSLADLAFRLQISTSHLRRVLVYGDRPSERLRTALVDLIGLPESDIFPERRLK